MARIEFHTNEITARNSGLAAQFEAELDEALTDIETVFTCQLLVDMVGDAMERIRVVLVNGDVVREWTMALPIMTGDVLRATQRAFEERRRGADRRHQAR